MLEALVTKAASMREAVLAFDKSVGHAANTVASVVPRVLACKLSAVQPDVNKAKQQTATFAASRMVARNAYQKLVDLQSINSDLLKHKDGARARDAVAVAMAAIDAANNVARDITPTQTFDCVPLHQQAQSLLVALASTDLVARCVRHPPTDSRVRARHRPRAMPLLT